MKILCRSTKWQEWVTTRQSSGDDSETLRDPESAIWTPKKIRFAPVSAAESATFRQEFWQLILPVLSREQIPK